MSLLPHDSYRYMNLKSMDGVKPSKKTQKSAIEKENSKLKRLLAEQAEELDIVKKAATYFAKNLK